jgi:hypothetical protein
VDYKAFYEDVLLWIQQANQAALRHRIGSEAFWEWVTQSASELGKKYQDNRLVIKQMVMLIEWLEEVSEARTKGGS